MCLMETDATPNPAQPKSRRRWYQFSLRTLLIGVVVLSVPCAYVAHEYRIVAARRAWLRSRPILDQFEGSHFEATIAEGDKTKAPSLLRRILGDMEITACEVYPRPSPPELKEMTMLFPETCFYVDAFRGPSK